jgi:hypothetical protein
MTSNRSISRVPIAVACALAGLFAAAPAWGAETARPGAGELSPRLDRIAGQDLRSASATAQAEAISLPARGPASLQRAEGSPVVEIRLANRTRARVEGLAEAGADVMHVSPQYRTVTAAVPERALRELAGTPGVEAVTEVLAPLVAEAGDSAGQAINACEGSITSEADNQLKAAAARGRFDVDGSGVKVGVLSDSYDTAAAETTHAPDDVASGDLPGPGNPCGRTAPVQVLADSPDQTDEGRAMLQLVHDLAPGADLSFATARGGELLFADRIRALAAAGADVIVDDILYFQEPMFQDGPVAVAVNDVTAAGVTYFSSAANNNATVAGNNATSWEAPAYRTAASCPAAITAVFGYVDQCLDFNPGAASDNTYAINVPSGRTARISLQWAQPQQGVTTDLDAYLLGTGLPAGETPKSEQPNVAMTQKPVEVLAWANETGVARTVELVVNRFTGGGGGDAATPRVKLALLGNGAAVVPTEYTSSAGGDVVGPTIYGHNGAANAMSTAAVRFNNPTAPEPFSSRGPVTHYFGPATGSDPAPALGAPLVLAKPDIAATDGTLTTFFGPGNRFSGTSAAAPHAAAVAALQLEANPAQGVPAVKAAQKATAVPVGVFGPTAVGAGLVDAVGAIGANPPAPPGVTIVAGPNGRVADRRPQFEFSATGDVAGFECRIEGEAPRPCSSPFRPATRLGDGAHTFTVGATDHFTQSGTASRAFTVDTRGPKVKLKRTPAKRTTKRRAKFVFSARGQAELFECALDRRRLKRCSSPFKVKVRPGRHRFRVRARDSLNNPGPTERYSWKRRR